jgi:hypothetical protein
MNGGAALTSDQRGFVLPIVIICLLLMGLMSVAAMLTADDEIRSGRAMHKASAAFYVAEAGLNEVFSKWPDYQTGIDALMGGDSLVLDRVTLPTGDTYQAVIYRWDDGVQPIYELVVEGRAGGPSGSLKRLSYTLTSAPGGPGSVYTLGECCEGAATVRGEVIVDGSGTALNGYDENPAGWDAGVCPESLYDKPGIRMKDTSLLTEDPDAELTGTPPIVQDPTIDDQSFSQFGPDLTWDDIKAMADFTWGSHGGSLELVNEIRPSYNGDGSCNTSDPYNWGSNDPSDACFDHFPIILIRGDFSIEASYGQAVFILDYYTSGGTNIGAEFDLDDDADLNGIILGKGCVELKDRGAFHGAVFVDGDYSNPLCGSDVTLEVKRDAQLDYSQCAVDRAILNAGLDEFAEAAVPGGASGAQLLNDRAFGEMFR